MRSSFDLMVEKEEVLRCLLRQEKEKEYVCLYRRKRRRSTFAFIVEKGEVLRCLLRQEKESSCRVLDVLPEKKNTQKASETTRSRNEKVKSFSTQTFIVSCPDVLPEKKSVQVDSVTIRNRDEMYSQPNSHPITRGTVAVRRSRKPRSRFLQRSAHPEVSTSISPSIVTLIQIRA